MINLSTFLSALSEPTRLGALRLLADGREHCVCELMQLLGATQSRMSRHMGVLKAAGIVTDRRDAQWVRYRRNPDLAAELDAVLNAVIQAVDTSESANHASAKTRKDAA
jgi:ArsR family transcriptional regulator